jgi:hypothetical protein
MDDFSKKLKEFGEGIADAAETCIDGLCSIFKKIIGESEEVTWENYVIRSVKTGKWYVNSKGEKRVLSDDIFQAAHWVTMDGVTEFMKKNYMSTKYYKVYSFVVEIHDDLSVSATDIKEVDIDS